MKNRHSKPATQVLRIALLGLVFMLLCAKAGAEDTKAGDPKAVDVTHGCGSQVLGKHLMLLWDEHRSMSIDEVSRPPISSRFEPSTSDKPNFGFTRAAIWVRLILVNRGSTPVNCLLEFDYPSMDTIEFFSPSESGGFNTRKLGDQEPFAAQTIKNRNAIFDVLVGPASTQVLTLRLSTSGSMQIPLRLYDPLTFFRMDHERQMLIGLYTGLLFVMALYNLFLFFSIRDRAYLAYVGYVVSVAAGALTLDGITYEYLLHPWPFLANKSLPISVALTGLFGTIFTSLFLKSKSLAPTIHRSLIILAGVFIVALPIAVFGPYALSIKVCAASAIAWPLPLLTCAIYVWKVHGYAPARFYILAWTTLLIGALAYALRSFGLLPSVFITEHGLALGSAVEVVLLSFALADRIKILERDKNTALAARLAEQERAESIQREAALAWQATFDAIGSGVCLLDKTGTVLRANQASVQLMGQPKGNVVGAQLDALLKQASGSTSSSPPLGFDTVWERMESFIEFGHRWYSVRHDPIRGRDEIPTGSVHIMTDVTAQRELEQQLYHAQKMDAIGRLAGGVAHDFNNLLSVIISYGEFLVESASNPDAKSDALEIVKAGQKAAGLTGQLLVFSRKQTLKLSVISPNDVINDLSKMLSRLIGENRKLRLELLALPGQILFDKAQLEQILVNLVVNGRDAIQGVGEIAIETRCLELHAPKHVTTGELRAGKHVTIRVTDSGMGIDICVLPRIFEPFFTTKGPGKGTGLGLAMVYGSVHQAGGFIDVTSMVGKGTQFSMYLPQVDQAAHRSSTPAPWKGKTKQGQTVLVVEDETPVRSAVRKILSSVGFHVLEAASAEAAIEVLEQTTKPVDILLTDIIMSGMSGVELVTKTAEKHPRMKVLYMSGYGFEALSEQGMDPASVHILTKPFTREQLLAAVSSSNDEAHVG